MHISCNVTVRDQIVETPCLVDSGAAGIFIDHNYVKKYNIPTTPLKQLIKVNNVDGTPNKIGYITRYATLEITIHGRTFKHEFLVTSLGREAMILGYTWLRKANPDINWKLGTLAWRETTIGNLISRVRR